MKVRTTFRVVIVLFVLWTITACSWICSKPGPKVVLAPVGKILKPPKPTLPKIKPTKKVSKNRIVKFRSSGYFLNNATWENVLYRDQLLQYYAAGLEKQIDIHNKSIDEWREKLAGKATTEEGKKVYQGR